MEKEKKERISKSINYTTEKINTIMKSRLIISGLMIVDGFNFIMYPNRSLRGMAQSVAISTFLASGAMLITNIRNKEKNVKNLVLSIIMIALSVVIFIFPDPFEINMRAILAAFIILNGLINIFNVKKLDKLSTNLSSAEDKLKNRFEQKNAKTYNKGVVLDQSARLLTPLTNFIEKANEKYYLYLILNIISVALGILLLTKDNITIIVCGGILIYTGIFDLLLALRSRRLSKKNQELNKES